MSNYLLVGLVLLLSFVIASQTSESKEIETIDFSTDPSVSEYITDFSKMSLDEQIDYFDPLDSAERLEFFDDQDFDNIEAELFEIKFQLNDLYRENEKIDEIIKFGDGGQHGYYQMPNNRLLYIADELLKRTGKESRALRTFRQKFKSSEWINTVTIPYNLGYKYVVRQNLRYVRNPALFAYALITQCDHVELLKPFETDLKEVINLYFTPKPLLIHAVNHSRIRITKYFLESLDANPKISTYSLETVFHVMNSNSNVEILTLLIDHGADIFARNDNRENILATWSRNRVPCRLFEVLAERIGRPSMVKLINESTRNKEYPLTIALHLKRYHLQRFLLKNGADVNIIVPAEAATTPLDCCIQAMANLIIGRKQIVERPPLNWAVVANDRLALQILLENAQMDFTMRNSFDESALIEAVRYNLLSLVKIIWLSGRQDMVTRDEDPVELARYLFYGEMVEFFENHQKPSDMVVISLRELTV